MQEKDWDELTVSKECETNEDGRPVNSTNDETQSQTSAERRVTRSTVRQQQNKCKQKAESTATSSAHDAAPCTFLLCLDRFSDWMVKFKKWMDVSL